MPNSDDRAPILVGGLVPDTSTESIIEIIQTDIANGRGHLISYVLLLGAHLGQLVDEGVITAQNLQQSRQEDGFLVVIPDVKFGEAEYTVKVASKERAKSLTGTQSVATMTANNRVV